LLPLLWVSKDLYRTSQISIRKMIYLITNIWIYTFTFGIHRRNRPQEGYLVINHLISLPNWTISSWAFHVWYLFIYEFILSPLESTVEIALRKATWLLTISFHYQTGQLAHGPFTYGIYFIYNLKVSFFK